MKQAIDARKLGAARTPAPHLAGLCALSMIVVGVLENGRAVAVPEPPVELGTEFRLRTLGPAAIRPFALQTLTREQRLDARLAAFARNIEKRPRREGAESVVFGVEHLERELGEIVASVEDRARISVHIRDLESDRVLFDYYGDTLLNPASNQKIVTSAAALDLLGPDYQFETEFLLEGDTLYVVGDGDPSLVHDQLWPLAASIAEEVSLGSVAKIVVDDSAFTPRRLAPGFDPEGPGASYQAPSGALSLDFNTVVVTVYGIKGGQRPGVVVDPPSTHIEVQNRARMGKRGSVRVRTRPGRAKRGDPSGAPTIVEVSGRFAGPPVIVRRRVSDPALFAGGSLAAMLAEITETEPLPVERGLAPAESEALQVIETHQSEPLVEIVEGVMAYSNNFTAEQLLRVLGHRMTGDPGSWDNGRDVVQRYWAALGNDPEALVFENGSGLSSVGRLTTSGLVDLLSIALRSPKQAGLLDTLPIAGETGTVRTRLRSSGKRVRAKTGTLDGVSGLSGVITTEGGRPQVAFSILINTREGGGTLVANLRRDVEDDIVTTVLDHLDAWHARKIVLELEPLIVTTEEDPDARG